MPFAEPASFPVGSILQGGYEILAVLGAGAFAHVYQARQLSTGQIVAIKVLRDADTGAFRREMQLCADLSHPHIVQLIDSGETDDGVLYAVFDFVPGATLRDVLAQEGALGLRETLHLMTQVLDALACAHACGVVHRDLKPENVILTRTGVQRHALVLDFGLGAFVGDAHERPGSASPRELSGTPCYAAPEQLRGEPPSTRSDLYSWGLILLECLTGKVAVGGRSAHDVLMKQLGPEPVPLPDSVPGQRLRRILQAVTAKEVEKRDVTIEGILDALRADDASRLDPRPAAEPDDHAEPEGERRQITAVSCRLAVRGAHDVDLEDVDALLHTQRARCAELAGRNGGELVGVLGDRLLFIFGHPRVHEDDARRAARTALDLVADVEDSAARRANNDELRLQAHVGIHSGLIVVRELWHGSAQRLRDVVGLTPQTAMHLDARADAGDILLSVDTMRLLRDALATEPAGEIDVPEIGTRVAVFRLARSERPSVERGGPPSEPPLVGRAAQIAELEECWRASQAGRPHAILVTGEPGIGKSRLARELRRRTSNEAWLTCRCFPENQTSPLRPIVDLLESLGRPLADFLAHPALAEAAPFVRELLGLHEPDERPLAHVPPELRKELTVQALGSVIRHAAETRPAILLIEDLHWADPTTLELCELLVRDLETAAALTSRPAPRLLVVFTSRPHFVPRFTGDGLSILLLQRLGREDVATMIRALLGEGVMLPPAVLDRIVERADGIPLFVEEVTRALGERQTQAGSPDADDLALDIPATLRDLLVARLDGLSPGARETAQTAAVLGREFPHELLRAVVRKDEASLRGDLSELIERGLVFDRRAGRAESWAFKHALVRDAAYDSLVRPARVGLHARVAFTLQRRFPDVERARPEAVALHLEYGGRSEEAAEYWKRAGDRTMGRGAYAEATQLFERGLGLVTPLADSPERRRQELGLTASLGTAILQTQGYSTPDVARTFERAHALCEAVGDEVPFRVLYGVWAVHLVRADADATARLLPMMHALAERTREAVAICTAHGAAGARAFWAGDFETALTESRRAIEWYDDPDLQDFVVEYGYDGRLHSHAYIMWALQALGFPEQAGRMRNEMIRLAEETGNPYPRALAYAFAGNLAHDQGDAALAIELGDRAIALSAEYKLYLWLATATCTRGWGLVRQDRLDEGLEQVRQGLGLLDMIGIRAAYPFQMSILVETHLRRGEWDAGLTVVEQALELCGTSLDCFYEAELLRLRGGLRVGRGEREAGIADVRRALALAHDQRARGYEIRAATDLGRLLLDDGARIEAHEVVSRAYAGFSEGFESDDLAAARAVVARCA